MPIKTKIEISLGKTSKSEFQTICGNLIPLQARLNVGRRPGLVGNISQRKEKNQMKFWEKV